MKFSEISEFLGGSREVEITEGKTLTIYPLKVEDLPSIDEEKQKTMTNEQKMDMSHNLILKSLDDPTVSIEDIKKLPASAYTKVMEAINEFNGFTEKNESIGDVKEKLARAREAKQKQ